VLASFLTLSWPHCSKVKAVTSGDAGACFGRPKVGVMCFFPVYTDFDWTLDSFAIVGGQWKQFV
jgi:hypothetical protein